MIYINPLPSRCQVPTSKNPNGWNPIQVCLVWHHVAAIHQAISSNSFGTHIKAGGTTCMLKVRLQVSDLSPRLGRVQTVQEISYDSSQLIRAPGYKLLTYITNSQTFVAAMQQV
jgi:hypothetical protein